MTPYEIPLTSVAQRFQITLGGDLFTLVTSWSAPSGSWVLDIHDILDKPLLLSIPLVTGTDLLKQHKHLGFLGSLYVQSDGDLNRIPAFDELGKSGHLYFVTGI